MTERFKPGDNILADKAMADTEKSIVNDIYQLKQPDKNSSRQGESAFTKKLAALDAQAHLVNGLLEGKPDLHIVGIFAQNLMLEHRNEDAKFPHHRYIVNPAGSVVGIQAIDEQTGKVEEIPGKKGGWQLSDEFKGGNFSEKLDGTKEMVLKNGGTITHQQDGTILKDLKVKENGDHVISIQFPSLESEIERKRITNTLPEDQARKLLEQENQNVNSLWLALERKKEIRNNCFDDFKNDIKTAHMDGQSNVVTIFKKVDEQIQPANEQLNQSKQRAELLQITVENFDYHKLIKEGHKVEADQLALKMLENHSSIILKDLCPDVWRKLGQPEQNFSSALQALKEVPQSDTGRHPAQILYTTSLDGKPPLSDVLDTKILAPNAFRLDALRAIDSDPTMIKIEQLAGKLNTNLSDLSKLAQDGSLGKKGEDFVDFSREIAKNIQETLKTIDPELLMQARKELHEMNAVVKQIPDITSQAELQKRIDAVTAMLELADPDSKMRKDVDTLTDFVIKRDFDADSTSKWVQQELPTLVGSIAGAAAAVAAVSLSLGTATPLVAAVVSAGAASTGWLAGGELTKEVLYNANNIHDIGIGSLNDRSKVGVYAQTPEEKRDFAGQVLGPYVTQIGVDTLTALATMGVVGLSKVGGNFSARVFGKEGVGKVLNTDMLALITREPKLQEYIVRARQTEELATKNPACREFLNTWLRETTNMAAFTLGQEVTTSIAAKKFGELDTQMTTGIALGLAIAHGHLKASDIGISKDAQLKTTSAAADRVEQALRKEGCEVKRLKNGDLAVKSDGPIDGIIRVTGSFEELEIEGIRSDSLNAPELIHEKVSRDNPKLFWPKNNERPVIGLNMQVNTKWCTAACGEAFLLAMRPELKNGMKNQKTIIAEMDGMSNAVSLKNFLNEQSHKQWEAGDNVHIGPIAFLETAVQQGKRWGAELDPQNPGDKDHHMVLIDKVDLKNELVYVSDPQGPKAYDMPLKDFLRLWSGSNYSYIREALVQTK
ncbi:MAG: hypothetical protein WC714_09385 [Candidatus Obscuribacterales bacterium]